MYDFIFFTSSNVGHYCRCLNYKISVIYLCLATHLPRNFTIFCFISYWKFKKISWRNWVQIFNDVGIECKKLHIQNSRHSPKEYTPHRIPKTDKTEKILKVLKYKHFPNLNIEELLSNEKGIELITTEESKYLKNSSRKFK